MTMWVVRWVRLVRVFVPLVGKSKTRGHGLKLREETFKGDLKGWFGHFYYQEWGAWGGGRDRYNYNV